VRTQYIASKDKLWRFSRKRSERGVPGEFAEIETMTADKLRAFIAGELEIAGISAAKH
jgi:hypothetical protein